MSISANCAKPRALQWQCVSPPLPRAIRSTTLTSVVVTVALAIVYSAMMPVPPLLAGSAESKRPATGAAEIVEMAKLPPNVIEMREMILEAVLSGRIEDLDHAISWNELPPEFGQAAGSDPIQHLKAASADGDGREILALIANVLALPAARLPIGKDVENNGVFVWPYLAEMPLEALTPAQEVDLLRLMPAAEAKALREGKKWTWWRLAIGADGTWHTFMRYR